ncbi:MAG: sulfite exporter TauE/SafE family protein [Chitinophagaceae bacterium]|nr:sulfite exporter TauE/SafE family protein [Chitinophagaceae bacterium]
MPTQEIVIIILIGLAAGVLSGLVGIGGGIILVPILVFFLGYTQYQAQGTSLAVLLLPVGILAFLNYYNECKKIGTPIDMRIVGLLAAGFVVGALGGSEIAGKINKELLKKIFAIVLLYTAIKMMNWDTLIFRWVKSIF